MQNYTPVSPCTSNQHSSINHPQQPQAEAQPRLESRTKSGRDEERIAGAAEPHYSHLVANPKAATMKPMPMTRFQLPRSVMTGISTSVLEIV